MWWWWVIDRYLICKAQSSVSDVLVVVKVGVDAVDAVVHHVCVDVTVCGLCQCLWWMMSVWM